MSPQDSTGREQSCEARIASHMEGRLDDFRVLSCLADVRDTEDLENSTELLAKGDALGVVIDGSPEEISESAYERIYEYPLGVSSYTTFRVDLSTGGPGDWLEVVCSGDTPNHEPAGEGEHYAVDRIVYHFADWFDHAERELEGDDFANAERFVSQVVPELVQ